MGGLSIKITVDTAGAVAAFNNMAGSSDELAAKIAKANEKLSSINVQDFINKQALSCAALQATRGEMGALESSITSYQRKIESVIKDSLDPESEQVKSLQFELETLKARRYELEAAAEAQAQKERLIAQAFDEAAAAAKREADIAVASLDAKTSLEKANIQLKSRQDELKDSIRALVESGVKPESAEVKKLEEEYKKCTAEIDKNTAAQKAQEGAVKAALGALAAIGAAVVGAGAYAINAAAKVEDMTAAFTPMMGSAEKAAAMVKKINKEAVTTPFEIDAISDSVKKLMPAFQGSETKAIAAFRMIGDTAGGNAQKLDTLTSAYTKVMLKGKTSMEELNMISGAGVPIFTELAASMGVTVEELMKMSSKGKITSDDLTGAFQRMTSEGGIFYQGMETSAFTFNSLMLGLKENVGLAAAAIGEELLPQAKAMVDKAGEAVASFVEWISKGDNLEKLLGNIGTAAAAAAAGLTVFVVISQKTAIINAMAAAVKGLMAAFTGPAGIAALAVAGIVAGIGLLVTHMNRASHAGETLAKTLADQKTQADDLLANYSGVNAEKELDVQTTAKLLELYPELNGMIDTATAKAGDYAAALEKINRTKALEGAAKWRDEIREYGASLEEAQKKLAMMRKSAEGGGCFYDQSSARETRAALAETEKAVKDFEDKLKNSVTQANALLNPIGQQVNEFNELSLLTTQTAAATDDLAKAQADAADKAGKLAEAEDPVERIIRQLKERTEEYGETEKKVGILQIERLKATTEQITRYGELADIMQTLKDKEEQRKKVQQDTQDLEKQAGDYTAKLEERKLKTDAIIDDETQLLQLQYHRQVEAINASDAEIQAKEAALAALKAYYAEEIRLSREAFYAKQEQNAVDAFKKNLDDQLGHEKQNMSKRMMILQSALQQIKTMDNISAESRKKLEDEVTAKIQEEAAKQKEVKIQTAMAALNAVSELTTMFKDLVQKDADERAEREKERLLKEQEEKQSALITQYNDQIKMEGLTEEEKQKIKEKFLTERKNVEEHYTKAMAAEEEKRKKSAMALAILEKVLASSQAAINSFLAFTAALASEAKFGAVWAGIAAGTVLAAGIAAQVKIMATPVTAETGGRFTVPDTGGGVDGALMRVNSGETVDVRPRGMGGGGAQRIIVQIDRQVIFDVVNEGIGSGDIIVSSANL